jgi:hypothetical protein
VFLQWDIHVVGCFFVRFFSVRFVSAFFLSVFQQSFAIINCI